MARLIAPGRAKRLGKGRVNAGLEAAYRKHLIVLIRRMHRDTLQTVRAHYRRAEPDIALDANPLTALRIALARLRIKWMHLFRDQAEALAEHVVRQGLNDTDADLKRRLKRAGFGLTFNPSADLQRRLSLATQENVQLITSIGEQYQQGVTSLVTDAVMTGGDLGTLTQNLQSRYGVSERKAATIARDQTHKINQSVERQRCGELGLKEAYWRHVGGGRFSRDDHRRADGKRYMVAEGCLISGEHIQPGQLVNCRCRAEYIIPGYNDAPARPLARDSAGNPDQPRDEHGRFVAIGSERFYHDYAKKRAQELDPSDRGKVLTRAGRALQKHGGRPGSVFPKPTGNPQKINAEGQRLVEEILDDPELLVFLREHHIRYGKSFHAFTKDGTGRGASFYPEHNMIGLREPLTEEQLENALRSYPHGKK